MSTKEMAINIINHMDESQLEAFVTMFKRFIPKSNVYASSEDEAKAKREAAFNEILALCKPVPDLDEEAELAKWRKEKFGI